MTVLLKTRDYFNATDVVKAGREEWERVRTLAKGLGFNVSKNFGNFDVIQKQQAGLDSLANYVVGLDSDGDFMCTVSNSVKFKGGRLRTMAEFKQKEFPYIKFRVNSSHQAFALVVDELKQRGYDDTEARKFDLSHYQSFVGVVGDKNGVIRVAVSEERFNLAYENADELLYDIKEVMVLDNIRNKIKLINVGGVMCEAKALQEFLDAQKEANPQ